MLLSIRFTSGVCVERLKAPIEQFAVENAGGQRKTALCLYVNGKERKKAT